MPPGSEKESTTQKDLKDMVGKRLKDNPGFAKILGPSRRCWNLDYPHQFHMDVLPSIANVEQLPDGILPNSFVAEKQSKRIRQLVP
jgi:hypothetical protein